MTRNLLAILTCSALLCTASAFALDTGTGNPAASACGDAKAKFDVETTKAPDTTQPDAAKATVYFIEDDSNYNVVTPPTTRIGVDGNWIGANHGSSYFSLVVEPGVHHLCASWQPGIAHIGAGDQTAVAHFTAEPGGVYFFQVRNTRYQDGDRAHISFASIDSDQGKLQMSRFKRSIFHPVQ